MHGLQKKKKGKKTEKNEYDMRGVYKFTQIKQNRMKETENIKRR